MNLTITLCLVCMLALTTYILMKLVCSDTAERLRFLKNFKKGKFAAIYFVAVPLFFLAHSHNGLAGEGAFWEAVTSSVNLVVLKYDFDTVAGLMAESLYFRVVMNYCYVLVTINACVLVFTLFGQQIINAWRRFFALRYAERLCLVVGYNDQNMSIVKSARKEDGKVVVLAGLDAAQKDALFCLRKSWVPFTAKSHLGKFLERLHLTEQRVCVVVNTGSDETNLLYLQQISELIARMKESGVAEERIDLHVYAFGEPGNVSAFTHFEEKTKGTVRYINKYRLVAMDFIDRYPITRFMTEELDTERGIVRNDVDVNYVLIGFGKTNLKLFLTSVENDQLVTEENGVFCEKPVSYWIYDKTGSNDDKNLNHGYRRYFHALPHLRQEQDRYLPLPPLPADTQPSEEHFFKMDINDRDFYLNVMQKLTPREARRSYNYVVVAFGTDMENLDLGEKLVRKLREWELDDFTKVFVKMRNAKLASEVILPEFASDKSFYLFGGESDTVYRLDKIMREKTESMAKRRHLCYAAEGKKEGQTDAELERAAWAKWYGVWNQVQRESNIYACLSLRMKLNLLGYDYVPAESGLEDESAAFFAKYESNDPVVYTGQTVKGRKIIDYGDCEFAETTIRARFAKHEHQRWNAYMICNGYIPASVDDILTRDKAELMRTRRHGNLTTFEGLKTYRKIVSDHTGISVRDADVIKYDYQLMDDAVWLLRESGYRIVEKTRAEEYRASRGL